MDIPLIPSHSLIFNHLSTTSLFIDPHSSDSLSLHDIHSSSHALSAGIISHFNIQKWNVIAIISPNNILFIPTLYSILISGATVTTINPSYSPDEIAFQLKDSATTLIFTHPSCLQNTLIATNQINFPKNKIILIHHSPSHGLSTIFDHFIDNSEITIEFSEQELKEKPAYITYSSGTTGKSKGVITTHYNMVANLTQVYSCYKPHTIPNETWIGILPFFHMYGLHVLTHLAPMLGIPVVILPSFELKSFVETVDKFKISTLFIVPPIIHALALHPIVDQYDMTCVKRVVSGAAPLSLDTLQAFKKRFGVHIHQGYGLTETSPVLALCPLNDTCHDESVGKVMMGMHTRIIDPETGCHVKLGDVGELWVRGPNVFKGYLSHDSSSDVGVNGIDSEGFFHTGDIVKMDEDGYLYIVDRMKDVIKCNGYQICPGDLESVIRGMHGIGDVCVVGKQVDGVGEVPLACVVRNGSTDVDEDAVISWVKEKVGVGKCVREVVFVDMIHKAPSGKVLRRVMRDKYGQ